ncbi:MAG: carboxymuconolactone decarboxylase family protein [Pseudomonadota bacterium]
MRQELKPLDPPFSDEVAGLLANYPQRDGYLLSLFRTFANSPRFLGRAVPNLLDPGSPLAMREREIVILRITANLGCEYEWGVHVTAFGAHVGLNEDQIAATRTGGPDAACWSDAEALLIRCVDALCKDGRIAGDTLAAFQEAWSFDQQLEILALAGTYHTVSFVANTANLAPEPFGARFPAG